MTERQQAFIRRLISEKSLPATNDANGNPVRSADADKTAYVISWLGGIAPEPTVAQASAMIDWLLALDNRPDREPRETNGPTVDVQAGRYALVGEDGTIKFYTVDRPDRGRWAGYTFLSAMGSDTRYPIRNRETHDSILAAIAADPLGAMKRYGVELGHCGRCGRELTDETSRAMGIGPECCRILGIDRTPYSERARREGVEAATGDSDDRAAEELPGTFTVHARYRQVGAEDLRLLYTRADDALAAAFGLYARDMTATVTVLDPQGELVIEYAA